jgi:F-type H+-transporting ATPase subunit epsilon
MAGKTIPFRLITPVAVAFEGEAELVIAVGTEGEEGILASHAPFLTALRPGILRANVGADGSATKRLEFATSEGFLQALPDRITVLADAAMQRDQVDTAAARADLEGATERQKQLAPQTAEYAREQSTIDFANARLQLAGQSA